MFELPQYPYPGDQNALDDVRSGLYGRHFEFKAGMLVLDIGAHVGFFAEWVRQFIGDSGKIVCIEPHPRNFHELKKRIVGLGNCALIQAAATTGERLFVPLWNEVNNSGGHSLHHCAGHDYLYSLDVTSLNVGKYCENYGLKPDFIKIDTEGEELVILKTLFASDIRPKGYAVECHSDELMRECSALLSENGYGIFQEGAMLFGEKTI